MSNSTLNESDQCLLEEIEALKAIFMSELQLTYTASGRPLELQTTLYPSTADDANQHYVCVTVVIKFPLDYPDHIPIVELKNPRGLADDFLSSTMKKCHEKCTDFSGCPVIYEIIELLRDNLTNSNRPTGHCTICLFGFHEDDVFTYTQCYHHFHSHCLYRFCESMQQQWKEDDDQEAINNPTGANWKQKKKRQFTCPVCRDVIDVDLSELKQAPQPYEVQNFKTEFRKDAKFVSLRQRMEAVYLKQKTNGGIIDQTAEDSRFLVVTEASSPTVEQPPAAPVQEPAVVIEASAIKLPEASKRGRGRWTRKPNAQKERPPVTANSVTGPPPKTASTRGSRNPSANIRETKTPRESHLPRHQVSRPPPGFEPR